MPTKKPTKKPPKKLLQKLLQRRPKLTPRPTRHFRKWRVVWTALAIFTAGLGICLVAFIAIKPFREEIDELYYTVYANYFVDPTLNNLSTQQRNVPYCGTASPYQKLDVYTPRRMSKYSGRLVPAVVYIHGGGWSYGNKVNGNITHYGTDIVRNGMALVSVNYRLAPDYIYPTQNNDVACAIGYLHRHAADFNIDPTRIGLWGDSAGGQLAALAAVDPEVKQAMPVKAVVEFYGTADIWGQITRKVDGASKPDKRAIAYLGTATNKKLADSVSPVNADLRGAPPFLLFHGIDDRIVPYWQSVLFTQRLQTAGVDVALRRVQNANHNFSSLSQPTDRQINAEMVDFFKAKL